VERWVAAAKHIITDFIEFGWFFGPQWNEPDPRWFVEWNRDYVTRYYSNGTHLQRDTFYWSSSRTAIRTANGISF